RTAGTASVLVGAEVEVVEGDGLTGLTETVVVVVVASRDRVGRGTRLLGGLDPDVAVALQAGASRDELTDDDVLLKAEEGVSATVDRSIGEHPGGLLEGGRREPRLRRERRLRDAHQLRTPRGRLAALGEDPLVLLLEAGAVDQVGGQ